MGITKQELKKCEKVLKRAIVLANMAKESNRLYESYTKLNESAKAELEQRKADQFIGEAIGINYVLTVLIYNHELMDALARLI